MYLAVILVAACGSFVVLDGYFLRENTTLLIIFVRGPDRDRGTPPMWDFTPQPAVFLIPRKIGSFERNCEMLGKLGTLFSSITASSSGSKGFPTLHRRPLNSHHYGATVRRARR